MSPLFQPIYLQGSELALDDLAECAKNAPMEQNFEQGPQRSEKR
jgi:hypothetical protein